MTENSRRSAVFKILILSIQIFPVKALRKTLSTFLDNTHYVKNLFELLLIVIHIHLRNSGHFPSKGNADLLEKRETSYLILYPQFGQEFKFRDDFNHPVSVWDAGDQRLLIKQWKQSAADYELNFGILAVESGWNEMALKYIFCDSLMKIHLNR